MHIQLLLSTKTVWYILPWVPEGFFPRVIPDSLWQRQHNDNKTNNADLMMIMMMMMITFGNVSSTAFIISLQFYFLFCHLFSIFSPLFFA